MIKRNFTFNVNETIRERERGAQINADLDTKKFKKKGLRFFGLKKGRTRKEEKNDKITVTIKNDVKITKCVQNLCLHELNFLKN